MGRALRLPAPVPEGTPRVCEGLRLLCSQPVCKGVGRRVGVRQVLGPESGRVSSNSTLFLEHLQQEWRSDFHPARYPSPDARAPGTPPVPPVQAALDVEAASVLEALRGKQDAPLLYLAHPVHVHGFPPDLQGRLAALFDLCPAPAGFEDVGRPS